MYTISTKILIEMNNNLGITVGVKAVPFSFEIPAKIEEIVNLAVKHYPDGAFLVENWLVAACKIDDAKPAHTEPGALLDKQPFIVGPAVNHGLAHSMDDITVNPGVVPDANDSRNPAHVDQPFRTAWPLSRSTSCEATRGIRLRR